MPEPHFTLDEANAALTELRPVAERMVDLRRSLGDALERRSSVQGRIAADGVQVKDTELGLLDFPALRDGREVLLCWHVGEDEIAYWHGPDEGFAGRKPVDFVE